MLMPQVTFASVSITQMSRTSPFSILIELSLIFYVPVPAQFISQIVEYFLQAPIPLSGFCLFQPHYSLLLASLRCPVIIKTEPLIPHSSFATLLDRLKFLGIQFR